MNCERSAITIEKKEDMLIAAGAFDALSAKLVEAAGFKAVM